MTSGRLLPGLTAQRLLTATPAARPLNKTTSAETADNAGTPQLKQFHMVNIKMWKHPKYYKELRKRNKPAGTGGALCVDPEAGSDQVISGASATASVQRALDPGHQHQASSAKPQAPSSLSVKRQASSPKHKGSSFKPRASSSRIEEPGKSFTHL